MKITQAELEAKFRLLTVTQPEGTQNIERIDTQNSSFCRMALQWISESRDSTLWLKKSKCIGYIHNKYGRGVENVIQTIKDLLAWLLY